MKRGGREVDDEVGSRRREVGGRRTRDPHVLADSDSDLRAGDIDERDLAAGHEVALLVEDAVVRQVPLPRVCGHFAVGADRTCVVEVTVE